MRYILTSSMILAIHPAFTRHPLPGFLQGPWKTEGKEIYEHWDRLNDTSMKGFSYEIKGGHTALVIQSRAVILQPMGKKISLGFHSSAMVSIVAVAHLCTSGTREKQTFRIIPKSRMKNQLRND